MITPELDCVFIETTTACTRKCTWCTHRYYDIKPAFMAEELFLKIVSELEHINFSGRLSFYLNGEPLLDKRLGRWVSMAKKSCPRSFTFIISNGDLLTYERAVELIDAGLDALKVNTYDNGTFSQVDAIVRRLPESFQKHIVHYDYSKKTDWTSRGGTVPVAQKQNLSLSDKRVCLRPFRQLYITHNGLVAQCCTDALNQYIMGDISKQSLSEIWNGEPFSRVRESLLGKGELNDLCRACDLERTYEDAGELRNLFAHR